MKSTIARDLIELQRLPMGGAGALTEHLLRELAKTLIAAGTTEDCHYSDEALHSNMLPSNFF